MDRKEEFLKNCIVLDTETTSLEYAIAEVIEFGYALFMEGKWNTYVDLYRPHDPISPEISAITNITQEMVEDKELFEDNVSLYKSLLEAFAGSGICVAHNSFYDMKVLERYGINYPVWLCTMRIAKKLYSNDRSVTQFKLPYLRYRFGILNPAHHNISAHRADSDALVTSELLSYFVSEMENREILDNDYPYAEQIRDWLEKPIIFEVMPFGKHKGKPLEDVPMNYWKWALANMDSLNETMDNYDKDFAASVTLVLDKKLS